MVFRSGGAGPALLYNNRALRAGNAPPRRRGPGRATPPSGPWPPPPCAPAPPRNAARRTGQDLPDYLLALPSHRNVPWNSELSWGARESQQALLSPHPVWATAEPSLHSDPPPVRGVFQRPLSEDAGAAGVLTRSGKRRRRRCSASARPPAGEGAAALAGMRVPGAGGGWGRLPPDMHAQSTVTNPRAGLIPLSLQALRQDFPMPLEWWGRPAGSARPRAPHPGSPARQAPLSEVELAA